MNHPARIFHGLANAWQQDAAGEAVIEFSASLAASLSYWRHHHGTTTVRLAVYRLGGLRQLAGLCLFLRTCGLELSGRRLPGGEAVLLTIGPAPEMAPGEHAPEPVASVEESAA